jgi:hypothetical protein
MSKASKPLIVVSYDMTPCPVVGKYQHFTGTVFSTSKVELNPDMAVVCLSETLVITYQTALRHIPDGLILTAVKALGYRSHLMN